MIYSKMDLVGSWEGGKTEKKKKKGWGMGNGDQILTLHRKYEIFKRNGIPRVIGISMDLLGLHS